MTTYIKAWLQKYSRFKWFNFNKRYMDGYQFGWKKLNGSVCVICLVAGSVGPDNHDEGLRDAYQDFKRFYFKKLKQNCNKAKFCKV